MLLLCRIFSCTCTHTLDATLQDLLFHLHTHTGCCVVGSSLAFAHTHTHTGCYVVVSSLALAHAHALDATSWGRLLLLSWWPCQLEKAGSFTLPETFDQKPCLIFFNMLNSVMSARWNFVIGVAIHMNTKKKWFADYFVINFPISKPTKAPQTHRPRNCVYLYRPPKSTHKGGWKYDGKRNANTDVHLWW